MEDRVIEAVLFDFGGVVVSSPFTALGAAGASRGVEPGVMLELLMGDYSVDGDHPFHRLERGEITLADYATDLYVRAAEAGIDLSGHSSGGLYDSLEVHPEVVDAIRALRGEGYRTALLTNNVREAGEAWRALVPLDELFDHVVDSCEVGMRKPNPAIYRHTLELLGVDASCAAFLDDAEGNVAAARAIGLHAILVNEPAAALAELDQLLGRGCSHGPPAHPPR